MKTMLAAGRIRPDNVVAMRVDAPFSSIIEGAMVLAERDDSHIDFHLPVGSMMINAPTNLVLQAVRWPTT